MNTSAATHVKFRVRLERLCAGGGVRNPFLVSDVFQMEPRRVLVREWEIEAKNEREVRRLLKEAQDADLPNVRGFNLRSIERIS